MHFIPSILLTLLEDNDFYYNQMKLNQPILFYDSECGLCSRTIQWVLKHEKEGNILFIALQSDVSQKYLIDNIGSFSMDTVILLDNHHLFTKSDAVIRIMKYMKFPYQLLRVFYIFPKPIRNWVYDQIAKRRKRFFPNNCVLPTIELKNRFIEKF